jgi:hypothetical protein
MLGTEDLVTRPGFFLGGLVIRKPLKSVRDVALKDALAVSLSD